MRSSLLKRAIDLGFGLALALVLFPVMLAIAMAVRVSLGSPVLFRQVRPGLAGRPFVMYKFRTMNQLRDENGKLLADEARLGRFGQWLRSSSFDELPELFNVIRGEMSLVGPRPLLLEYLPLYSNRQRKRHEMRPGITGWAQVNGRNGISWRQKFEYDVWYVDHWSLLLDLRILGRTLGQVLRRRGVSQEGTVSAEKFTGNQR